MNLFDKNLYIVPNVAMPSIVLRISDKILMSNYLSLNRKNPVVDTGMLNKQTMAIQFIPEVFKSRETLIINITNEPTKTMTNIF